MIKTTLFLLKNYHSVWKLLWSHIWDRKKLIFFLLLRNYFYFTLNFSLSNFLNSAGVLGGFESWLSECTNYRSNTSFPDDSKVRKFRDFIDIWVKSFQIFILFFEVHSSKLKKLNKLFFTSPLISFFNHFKFVLLIQDFSYFLACYCLYCHLYCMILRVLHCII